MPVTHDDIDGLIKLVDELCGLYLDQSKGYLIESRLENIATKYACRSYGELAKLARNGDRSGVRNEIVDAITTNETLFFRDHSPFDALRFKIVPEIIDQVESGKRPRKLRIWSAACSTGQEPYSLAMTLCDVIPDVGAWDIRILGTDVSCAAIAKAESGTFSELELSRGVDAQQLSQFFVRDGEGWKITSKIRQMVQFKTRNLLTPFAEKSSYDVVLCRNVAIYFRKDQRDDLFRRIASTLVPDGFLFVGSAESLTNLATDYVAQTHCNCTVYRPKQHRSPLAI